MYSFENFRAFFQYYHQICFISLIPCTVYLVFCFYRYISVQFYKIRKQKKEDQQILLSPPLKMLPNSKDIESILTMSFVIKQKMVILVILTLFCQLVYEVFYFQTFEFIYIEIQKVIVWIINVLLSKSDFINKKKPKFHENGLFWLFSFLFDIWFIISILFIVTFLYLFFIFNFYKEKTLINVEIIIAIYIFRIISEMILTIYGFFKLNDVSYDENMITVVLDAIETKTYIQFLFNYKPKKEINDPKFTELQSKKFSDHNSIITSEFPSPISPLYKIIEDNPSEIKVEINKYICFKQQKYLPQASNFFLYIKTTLNKDSYFSEKSFPEIDNFLTFIKDYSYMKKQEDFDFFRTLIFQNEYLTNTEKIIDYIKQLEEALQILLKDPTYSNLKELLKFLNINKTDKKPMLLFQGISRNFNRSFDASPPSFLQKAIFQNGRRRTKELILQFESPSSDDNCDIIRKFFLKISSLGYKHSEISANVEFNFQITNFSETPYRDWVISKTLANFKQLNNDLEKLLGNKIACFYTLILKPSNYIDSNDPEFLNKRQDSLFAYLDVIVRNFNYHGEILYSFLNFDEEKGNTNSPIQNSSSSIPFYNSSKSLSVTNAKKSYNPVSSNNKYQEEIRLCHIFDPEQKEKLKLNLISLFLRNFFFIYFFFAGPIKKKIVNGINFNFARIKLKALKGVKTTNLSNGVEEFLLYHYIDLEEYDENWNKIKTHIKMVKQYKDFMNFTCILNNLHSNLGFLFIKLPAAIKICPDMNFEEIKEKWDNYLEEIRISPRIEDNESFKEFFCLNRLGNQFQYYRDIVEILDFTS